MSKATKGHGRVTEARLSGTAGTSDKVSKPRDVAELICAVAYTNGGTGGVFSAGLSVLPRRLKLPQRIIDDGLSEGEACGWLRRRDDRVELTAAGVYTAKVSLNLPT